MIGHKLCFEEEIFFFIRKMQVEQPNFLVNQVDKIATWERKGEISEVIEFHPI